MNLRILLATLAAVGTTVQAQSTSNDQPITLTTADMFNAVGQSYSYYINSDPVPTGPALGNTGGPQSWDFTTGPTNKIFKFDYLSPTNSTYGVDFPDAQLAERKTDTSDGSQSWLFLKQLFGTGRINYGFYDPTFSPDEPEAVFSTPIVDFPDPIHFGDTWTTSTSFHTTIDALGYAVPAIISYSSSAKADAYGVVNLPKLGFGPCLRINELAQYDISVDIEGTGTYTAVETDYIRNYYWIQKGHGIVAQITSQQGTTPPPDNFSTAAQFARMFQIDHQASTVPPEAVTDLKITLGSDGVLLSWTKALNATSYRVEYTTDPGSGSWQVLGTTSTNYMIDDSVKSQERRFYRVIALQTSP